MWDDHNFINMGWCLINHLDRPSRNIFKQQWERLQDNVQIEFTLLQKLMANFTKLEISGFSLLTSGRVNTNYKITLKNGSNFVLRIYSFHLNSFYLESYLFKLLRNKLPVPEILFSDSSCKDISFPYCLMKYIDGDLLSDLIYQGNENIISECAFDAGRLLSRISQIQFSEYGIFHADNRIQPFSPKEYFLFLKMRLENQALSTHLGERLKNELQEILKNSYILFSNLKTPNLIHGDYDPTNLIVKKIDGRYKIISILDWEASLSSHYLFDMGIFLRYSDRLPVSYEESFVMGITDSGIKLPSNWKVIAKLFDLIALINVLSSNLNKNMPNFKIDVKSLIVNIVSKWSSFGRD